MGLWNTNNIDRVWKNICKYEGETFHTIRNIEYKYVVKEDYILINNDPRRKIKKSAIEKAIRIENPTPSKINKENIWGPSYVYGMITDRRIFS